jgi:hypothetical protein
MMKRLFLLSAKELASANLATCLMMNSSLLTAFLIASVENTQQASAIWPSPRAAATGEMLLSQREGSWQSRKTPTRFHLLPPVMPQISEEEAF